MTPVNWVKYILGWMIARPRGKWTLSYFRKKRFQKIYFLYTFLVSDAAKWIWDSSIFSSNKPKLGIGFSVDFCVFTCFYQFLHDVLNKLVCFDLQNNFMIRSWKKQSDVKFWLNWIKYRAVSYSLSCTWNFPSQDIRQNL